MAPLPRRSFMAALSVASVGCAATARAVDALPDARFVGFAQAVNDFGIGSGNLALARSGNENIRGYATRAVAEYPKAVQSLSRNRSEAGVTMAPDEDVRKIADDAMSRLNSAQGAEFDKTYADAQVRLASGRVDVAQVPLAVELRQRVEEAARYIPLERLGLSPQCGFASTMEGNLLSFEDQRRKLELVASVAREVWRG